jgi:16S rRNA U516 pseudouridylate synthase RsuA-like enzyme
VLLHSSSFHVITRHLHAPSHLAHSKRDKYSSVKVANTNINDVHTAAQTNQDVDQSLIEEYQPTSQPLVIVRRKQTADKTTTITTLTQKTTTTPTTTTANSDATSELHTSPTDAAADATVSIPSHTSSFSYHDHQTDSSIASTPSSPSSSSTSPSTPSSTTSSPSPSLHDSVPVSVVRGERLSKVMSSLGLCSRRDAEKIISQSRVRVDGKTPTANMLVVRGEVEIIVDGKVVLKNEKQDRLLLAQSKSHVESARHSTDSALTFTSYSRTSPQDVTAINPTNPHPRLWLYYKPPRELVTVRDKQGRQTIFDSLKLTSPTSVNIHENSNSNDQENNRLPFLFDAVRLVSIGRLDFLSEGLLLLSNRPEVAHFLESSHINLPRQYRIKTIGRLLPDEIRQIEQGLNIDGFQFKPAQVQELISLAAKEQDKIDKLQQREEREVERETDTEQRILPSRVKKTSQYTWYLVTLREGKVSLQSIYI